MRLFILLLSTIALTFAFTSTGSKKDNYPQDYFRSPVDNTIYLSGTFGELRPNHFHAGIDIKAYKGKTGQGIYAIAEGYISRIKVESGGYGNVIYISHPNGYTSVYAHLNRFTEAVAKYVKEKQYEKKSFEVDLYVPKNEFLLSKGEQIGRLGVSGRSFGPHLHFEIRDSKTEKPINPLLFGFKVADTKAPRIHELKAYFLNEKRETQGTKTFKATDAGTRYRIKGDTLMLGAWRVGFGLKAYDHMNGVSNWNGIYSLDMYQDDELVYNFEMETFSFDESRYINAHLDYEEQQTKKSYFNRCFSLPGNFLSIYDTKEENGVIKLHKGNASKITMVTKDVEGNSSKLEFWVKRAEVEEAKEKTYNYVLLRDEENIIDNKALYMYFPKGTLYEDLYLTYRSSIEKSDGIYSAVHHVHEATTPLHKYCDIAIQSSALPDDLKDKAFISFCDNENKPVNCGGAWKAGRLSSKIRSLGDYCIMLDEVPPKVTPVAFSSNMKGYNKMSFKITDNYATARNVEAFDYTASVDGQWILMEYDAKNDLLFHKFDNRIKSGEHLLRLLVKDSRGNETVFERKFIR